MIKLTINDKEVELTGPVTAQQLLEDHGLNPRFIALVRNDQIVQKSTYASQQIGDGDVVSIYRVIAGG